MVQLPVEVLVSRIMALNGNSCHGYPIQIKNDHSIWPNKQFYNVLRKSNNPTCGNQQSIGDCMVACIFFHTFEREESNQGWVGVTLTLDKPFDTNKSLGMQLMKNSHFNCLFKSCGPSITSKQKLINISWSTKKQLDYMYHNHLKIQRAYSDYTAIVNTRQLLPHAYFYQNSIIRTHLLLHNRTVTKRQLLPQSNCYHTLTVTER